MTIPYYQELMLPLLVLASDGKERPSAGAVDSLSAQFSLSDEERLQLLPSGRQTTIANRVGWAKTYLAKAGLLLPKKGVISITDRGREVIATHPGKIDVQFLKQLSPEFVEFYNSSKPAISSVVVEQKEGAEKTPREVLEGAFQELNTALGDDLLERVKANSPEFFERLVVRLLETMYGGAFEEASSVVGAPGDRGIDGVVKQDILGLDAVYIQAKRYGDKSVGGPEVRNFAGALLQHGASKGVLITTSTFSDEARKVVEAIDKRIALVDGQRLAELMIRYDIGVSPDQSYNLKRMDGDYFEEE